jgi:negative regulator of flagellin synthesis FlgM
MKVSDLKNDQTVQYINQGNKANPGEKAPGIQESQEPNVHADRVEISAQSRDLKKMNDILAQTPDIRMEKVAALKKAVEEGRYQVNAANIAGKMVKEILVESNKE